METAIMGYVGFRVYSPSIPLNNGVSKGKNVEHKMETTLYRLMQGLKGYSLNS